ncbi:MAG: LuxR C-terminal-related transcriptional regulator [Thermomicrobiales bacterium]
MDAISVVLATTQPLIRAGLQVALLDTPDLCLVGEAATGAEVRHLCQARHPAVVVLDARLTRPAAPETVALLRRLHPEIRIIILAPTADIAAVRTLIALGAVGAVSLDDSPTTIVQAITIVGQGGAWCSPPFLAALAHGAAPALHRLSTREREVLVLLALGQRNAEIAATLAISVRTVEHHITHILQKLDAQSRTESIHNAYALGLLLPDHSRDNNAA